ncbi:MAG: hypothetical protein E7592_05995 [Ruminococcaceae bacterium]|nr:hypothetical protein [Oscillospiraceae bacterium]
MKNIFIKNKKALGAIRVLLSLVLFITPIIYLFVYVFYGTSSMFGDAISLFDAIDLTIGVFNLSTASVYRPIFGAVTGIAYFVILGMIISKIITSASQLKLSLKSDQGDKEQRPIFTISLMYNFGNILFLLIVHMVMSKVLFVSDISSTAVAVVVSGLVISVLSKIGIHLIENKNLTESICQYALGHIIVTVAIAIFMFSVCRANLYEFFIGFSHLEWLFDGASNTAIFSAIGNFFVENVVFLILQIFALQGLDEVLSYYSQSSPINKTISKKLMMGTICICSILIAIAIYISDSTDSDTIFLAVKPYISILACSIAIHLTTKFPKLNFEQYHESDNDDADVTSSANENTPSSANDSSVEPEASGIS